MEKYPEPISICKTKKILEQMEKSNYKIHNGAGKYSNCLFSYIKIKDKNIPVLIVDKNIIKK